MALIKCTECNHDVSDKAQACPSCGAPVDVEQIDGGAAFTIDEEKAKSVISDKKNKHVNPIISWAVIGIAVYFLYSQIPALPVAPITAAAPTNASTAANSTQPSTDDNLTNVGYTGCITESYYDELNSAVTDRNNRAVQFLLDNQYCVTVNEKLEFSVIDRGFLTSEIRIYVNDASVVLFVPSEMIR
jgi:hypothetical protein